MNATQVRYARERAASIKRELEHKLSAERFPQARLTDKQKIAALKAGEFTVDKSKNGRPWASQIVFDGEPQGLSDEAYNASLKKVRDAYTRVIDELVLGDNEAALALLKVFASTLD